MPVPVYRFIFDQFQIFDTRARHQDTDYASFSVVVGKATPQPKTQYFGNVGNGSSVANMIFDDVPVGSYQTVFVNNIVLNHGNGTEGQVEQDLFNAGVKIADVAVQVALYELGPEISALTTAALTAIGTQIGLDLGTLIPVPLVGSAVGALTGFLIGKIAGIINADCDGVVAAELAAIQGGDLWALTADGAHQTHTNHVVSSPDGCNTSSYTVTWTVQRVVRTVVSALNDRDGVMHLFAVGKDGVVYTQYSKPFTDWQPLWMSIDGGVFSQGTPVTSLLDKDGVIHLFALGEEGAIWTHASASGWTRISDPNFLMPMTVISAIIDSKGLISLYAVGMDGRVWAQTSTVTTFYPSGWLPVGTGVFTQGTTVTSLIDRNGVVHLFAVGKDGKVCTLFTVSEGSWNAAGFDNTGWGVVSTGVFSQGITVSALLDGDGATHLFAVGDDGFVYTQFAKEGGGWNAGGWVKIPGGTFSPGTPVTSLLDEGGVMHLFAVGQDGYVYTQWSKPFEDWNAGGWAKVPVGVFKQSTTTTPLLDNTGAMHLFAVGQDGKVYTQFSKPFADWNASGWPAVSTGVFNAGV
jgi:hypothetical protein